MAHSLLRPAPPHRAPPSSQEPEPAAAAARAPGIPRGGRAPAAGARPARGPGAHGAAARPRHAPQAGPARRGGGVEPRRGPRLSEDARRPLRQPAHRRGPDAHRLRRAGPRVRGVRPPVEAAASVVQFGHAGGEGAGGVGRSAAGRGRAHAAGHVRLRAAGPAGGGRGDAVVRHGQYDRAGDVN